MKPTTIAEFFQLLPASLDRDAAEDVTVVYQFDLSGAQGGQYSIQVQNGVCTVQAGVHADPNVMISMAGDDCLKLLNGKLNVPASVMTGRLRVSGDMGLAMQLKSLFPILGA
jgi:putative sterol carrier protein